MILILFINSYGSDHDADTLNNIAQLKSGNFYFVQDLKSISDWFILSLSGLLSVVAESVQVSIMTERSFGQGPDFQWNKEKKECVISKLYGEDKLWSKDKDNLPCINITHLVQDKKREYIFELTLPSTSRKLKDEEKCVTLLTAKMTGKLIKKRKIPIIKEKLAP